MSRRPTNVGGMQMPLFQPESDWQAPRSLPTVPSGVVLAVDTEGRDTGLATETGPGWATRNGYLVGVSVAWGDTGHYIPIRHPDTENLPAEEVFPWLEDAMRRARVVVFHNRSFDEGWLSTEDCAVPESADDTHAMAVMCDENRLSYSLDACCAWRGIPGKDERQLREAAAAFGVDPKADLWRLPARHVGPYAIQDAVATLRLWESLWETIREQDLEEAYRLEMDLVPCLIEMRRRGMRVDEVQAERTQIELFRQRDEVIADLRHRLAMPSLVFDHVNSPRHLESMFTAEQIEFPRTAKTNQGSFKKDWMQASEHWLPQAIVQARGLNDMADKFIGTYLLGSTHVGRIHAEIHPLRSDDAGTRSYRFSYSNPPLQQIPARDPVLSPLIRGILLPERGQFWLSADYSQQEPRMAVHFAVLCKLAGSQAAWEYYAKNPAADFHQMVSDLTGVPRKQAKIINLGLMYGMGLAKLARSLGVTVTEATEIIEQYNERMPFVKALAEFCEGRAGQRGFVRLLDGARCRFDLWEPAYRGEMRDTTPRPRTAALEAWPGARLRRAHTRKAMNRLVQGSSARQTKLAMRECWRQGIVPLLQMHDELDFSVDDERTVATVEEIMVDVVQLKVPMKVDCQLGYTWGQSSIEPPKGTEPPSMAELRSHGPGATNQEIYDARRA